MNKLILTSLLIVFLLGMTSVNAQKSESTPVITLERGACFRTCPIYTVNIFEDGTVSYKGENFVTITGEQTGKIDLVTVQMMLAAFADAGYFDWNKTYTTRTITDLPTVITSVSRNGKTQRIERYAGDYTAPLALPFLENWIDEVVNTQLWTGVQPNLGAISNGTDTPFITLQRTACFGTCPAYSVAMFKNGTVVYTGIGNVKAIGVRVLKTDADSLNGIAQRAQIFGYFRWQDNYQKHVRTDQGTVIIAIRWEDQSKRVVRYSGDPSAPIGLIWIEDNIDQIVKDMIG